LLLRIQRCMWRNYTVTWPYPTNNGRSLDLFKLDCVFVFENYI